MVAFVRAEMDMFRIADLNLVQAVCNPVSTSGMESGGLAGVFKNKAPLAWRQYYVACLNEKLSLGDALVCQDDPLPYYVISLPTKESIYDKPTKENITIATLALATAISNLGVDIAVPMIGCGKDYEYANIALPIMMEILDPLPVTIHICVKPAYFKTDHVVLGIMSPITEKIDLAKAYAALNITNPDVILTLDNGLKTEVSNTKICKLPVNVDRFGNVESATDHQLNVIADAATHIIAAPDVITPLTKPVYRLPAQEISLCL